MCVLTICSAPTHAPRAPTTAWRTWTTRGSTSRRKLAGGAHTLLISLVTFSPPRRDPFSCVPTLCFCTRTCARCLDGPVHTPDLCSRTALSFACLSEAKTYECPEGYCKVNRVCFLPCDGIALPASRLKLFAVLRSCGAFIPPAPVLALLACS